VVPCRARGAVRDDVSCGDGSEFDTEEQFLTLDDIAEGRGVCTSTVTYRPPLQCHRV